MPDPFNSDPFNPNQPDPPPLVKAKCEAPPNGATSAVRQGQAAAPTAKAVQIGGAHSGAGAPEPQGEGSREDFQQKPATTLREDITALMDAVFLARVRAAKDPAASAEAAAYLKAAENMLAASLACPPSRTGREAGRAAPANVAPYVQGRPFTDVSFDGVKTGAAS